MEEYARRNPRHPNLARSLVNMASAERLMCLQLRKKIDAVMATRKATGGREPAAVQNMAHARARLGRLREKALEQLAAASEIYQSHGNHRGMGAVHILRGSLSLGRGVLDREGLDRV